MLAAHAPVMLLMIAFSLGAIKEVAADPDQAQVRVTLAGDLQLLAGLGGRILLNNTDVLNLLQALADDNRRLAADNKRLDEAIQSLEARQTQTEVAVKSLQVEENQHTGALQNMDSQLEAAVNSLEAKDSQQDGAIAARLLRGTLPTDLGSFTRAVLQVKGAGLSAVNGYYSQLPGTCMGSVCYSKIMGPEVRITRKTRQCSSPNSALSLSDSELLVAICRSVWGTNLSVA